MYSFMAPDGRCRGPRAKSRKPSIFGFEQGAEPGRLPRRPAGEAQPGDADCAQPVDEQVRVALAVLLERVLVVAAVELGDEALRAPEGVGLVAVDDRVHLGPGEVIAGDEGQERVLECRARGRVDGDERRRVAAGGTRDGISE